MTKKTKKLNHQIKKALSNGNFNKAKKHLKQWEKLLKS